jgi:hypothetical protein
LFQMVGLANTSAASPAMELVLPECACIICAG